MRFKNLLKHVFLIPFVLVAGLTTQAQLLNESFDASFVSVPPANPAPAGWVNVNVPGDDPTALWERATANADGGDPATFFVNPHSGAGMIQFRSYDINPGNGAYLASPSFSLAFASPQKVSFWMYRDVTYTNEDSVSVYVNTAQDIAGATFLGKVLRKTDLAPAEAADGWYQYSFAIPASFTGASNYVIIKAAGEYGNNMFVDDVTVEDNPICSGTPVAGTIAASETFLCGSGPVDVSVAGATSTGGITIQWQSSPAGANTFTNIVGAIGAAYTATVTAATDYRAVVTCSNSGLSATSDIATVNYSPGPPANDESCDATALTVGGASSCGNTTCATTALDEPESGCSSSNNTVWYKFTATASGNYNILLEQPATGTDYLDAWVHVYTTSTACPAPTFTQLNNDCLAADAVVLTSVTSGIVTIPGLVAGTEYYVRLDGVSGAFGSYCISVDVAPPPPGCTTNTTPANAATNVAGPVTFAWNAAANADGYTFILSTSPTLDQAGDTLGATAGTSIQLFGLLSNTTYYWYAVPFNSGGVATGCITNATSFTTGSVANNDCSNAVNLTVADGFCANPVLGTLAFADSVVGFTSPVCSPNALPSDVWYTVTVPASGNVVIQTSAVNDDVVDLVAEAYSGTCGGLTLIGCSEDDNPDDFSVQSQYHARLSLIGRTPNEVIYVRVMPYSALNAGAFAICAWDSTAVAPVALGTACTNTTAVTIDSAFKFTWATLKTAGGDVVAQIFPNGSKLGSTSGSFYVNTGAVRQNGGVFYLDRNVTITPTTQPDGALITRVYFTDAELAALAAVAGGATAADLNCTKTSQTCATSAAVGNGGTYYDQAESGDYGGFDHFASVVNDTYSTFYLHKGTVVLPVTLASFNAIRSGNVNKLNWVTAQEISLNNFVVQRSANGREFSEIGRVAATGNTNNSVSYNFTDDAPARALNYYRLKIVDNNGQVKYSAVRTVRNEGTADVFVAPNPVTGVATVKVSSDVQDRATITVTDMNGKALYRSVSTIAPGSNNIQVNMAAFSAGTYVVKVQLNNDFVIKKINKQ